MGIVRKPGLNCLGLLGDRYRTPWPQHLEYTTSFPPGLSKRASRKRALPDACPRASEGQGGLSAQAAEPDGKGYRLGSAHWESFENQGQGVALLGALRMEQPRRGRGSALARKPRGEPMDFDQPSLAMFHMPASHQIQLDRRRTGVIRREEWHLHGRTHARSP
ncbi:MAG: hypothetical protein ACREX9_15690 [Gammaproteobacteria bacterium]